MIIRTEWSVLPLKFAGGFYFLWKAFVNWDDYSPYIYIYIWTNKTCSKPPTSKDKSCSHPSLTCSPSGSSLRPRMEPAEITVTCFRALRGGETDVAEAGGAEVMSSKAMGSRGVGWWSTRDFQWFSVVFLCFFAFFFGWVLWCFCEIVVFLSRFSVHLGPFSFKISSIFPGSPSGFLDRKFTDLMTHLKKSTRHSSEAAPQNADVQWVWLAGP